MPINSKTPNIASWLLTLAALVYCVYGLSTNGIYMPLKHHSYGLLVHGVAGAALAGGAFLMFLYQTIGIIVVPKGAERSDIPIALRAINWVGIFAILISAFLPGAIYPR